MPVVFEEEIPPQQQRPDKKPPRVLNQGGNLRNPVKMVSHPLWLSFGTA
jgi:hypothetical protein